MLVKRTKSGGFTFELSLAERQNIFNKLCNFCEDESVKLMHVKLLKEQEIMRHLYYSNIESLIKRLNFHLQTSRNFKWTINRAEAIALMWFLRNHDHNIELLQLKAGLHKQLNG
jgi:hypothetical protein